MEEVRKLITVKDEEDEKKEGKFHVALLGFNKKEVMEYIAALEANMKAGVESYEKKIEEQSTALSMALREKEKLMSEVSDLREKVGMLSDDANESELAVENIMMKAKIAELLEIERKNEHLVSELNNLKKLYECNDAENKELKKSIAEKEKIILQQCHKNIETEKNLKLEIEKYKSQAENTQKICDIKIELAQDNLRKALNILEHS